MICDVCDEASKDIEETFMKHHVPGYGEGKSHAIQITVDTSDGALPSIRC